MGGFFINFFECKLRKYNSKINYLPYEDYSSGGAYKKLRESYGEIFFSRYGDKIYYWELNKSAKSAPNGNPIDVDANEFPLLFKKIIELAIITRLKELSIYDIFYHKYSNTYRIISKQDLLSSSVEGLIVKRQVNLGSYFFKPEERILFGILLSSGIKNEFTWKRKDFEDFGIDTSGLKGNDEIVYANRKALKRFLASKGTEEHYQQQIKKLDSNEQRFEIINKLYDWLSNNKEEIYLPDENEILNINKKYLPLEEGKVKSEYLFKPRRFYYSGQISENSVRYYDQQVKKYRPYSYEIFENKRISIGILCPKSYEGVTEGFINKLERKLNDDLHLKNLKFEFRYIETDQINDYKEGIYDDKLLNSNLVMVVVTEEHEKLPDQKSPYYYCKAKFIGNGIPTQEVQVKNIKNYNRFILNNISLNIYAKLGGTAWTIEREEKRKEELVIGIGSTIDFRGGQILGIAQVFHSDGRYIVGDCSPLSTYENYAENLQDYLTQTLRKIISDHIDINREFRLVFHLFKSASKRYEIKAIEKTVDQFADLSFKYGLVHLGYGHNFRLFFDDGRSQVGRGTFIKLDDSNALLHFVPNSDTPLLIQLDKRSTFKDLYYLSKQIYWFSYLSHRSYSPAKKTITILYPNLMANLTEKLKIVEGWDYDRLKIVSEKLWFI